LRFAFIRSALLKRFLQRFAVRYFDISNTGRVRRNNQDRILADEQMGLWIVADGMGGHAGGAEASRLACEAVNEGVVHGMPLADAFEVAHSRVRSAQEENPSLHDMGTTLVAVREHDGSYELAWVGDSRVYRYNSGNGEFECLTRDQNVAGRLLETGRITEDQAREHPQRHILTDCIGQREGLPTIESTRIDWRDGDRLLLCSDGLNSELDDAELKKSLAEIPSPHAAAEKLVDQALQAGGKDNISLIILDAPKST
jgi:protein phosphatase